MKLVLLRCPECSRPLTPENDDVVVACSNCRTPVAIGANGPSRISVQYGIPGHTLERYERARQKMAAQGQAKEQQWFPFWIFSGRVNISRRETQGGGRSGRKESEALWGTPRRLYVPAWELSLRTAQDIGSRLAQGQPEIEQVSRPGDARLVTATVTPGDAKRLLEFVVLAIEARRRDWLKDLKFTLDVDRPKLWALPEGTFP